MKIEQVVSILGKDFEDFKVKGNCAYSQLLLSASATLKCIMGNRYGGLPNLLIVLTLPIL